MITTFLIALRYTVAFIGNLPVACVASTQAGCGTIAVLSTVSADRVTIMSATVVQATVSKMESVRLIAISEYIWIETYSYAYHYII